MLRTDFPIYFDDTEIGIKPLQWNRSYANVETKNQTEDGHDDIETIRRGKTTISAQFRTTDEWASVFAAFNSSELIEVRFYDVEDKDYTTLDMRMDGLSINMIKGSDRLWYTNGTYNISFNLVEF